MQLFFFKSINLGSMEVFFDDNESYHIIKVMRKKKGDIINATDGNGILLEIKITSIKSNRLIGLLLKKTNIKANKHSPDIGICIPKKTSRFEWFIEKATEIGIRNIYPIISHNTEKKNINYDRCKKIIKMAAKQSNNFYLPEIKNISVFKDFVVKKQKGFIANCSNINTKKFNEIKLYDNPLFLVGPEGDFSDFEYEFAKKNGYVSINFGKQILRSETAAIYICSICNNANNFNL